MPSVDWLNELAKALGTTREVPKTPPTARITVTPPSEEVWKPIKREPLTAPSTPANTESSRLKELAYKSMLNPLSAGEQAEFETLRAQNVAARRGGAPVEAVPQGGAPVEAVPQGGASTDAISSAAAEIAKEQGGIGTVYLGDLAKKTGLSVQEIQRAASQAAQEGRATLAESSSVRALEVPGRKEAAISDVGKTYHTITFKNAAPAVAGGAALAAGGEEAKAQDAEWKPVKREPLPDQWKPIKREPLSQESQWSPGAMLRSALKPITSYPETYKEMNIEARTRMGEGVEDIKEGKWLRGGFKTALGTLGYATSPIDAAARTVVGKPIEDLTGIPKEYTEFAAMLALPIIGLTGTSKGKDMMRPIETILSPNTVSNTAKDAEALIRSTGGTAARDTAKTEAALEAYHAKVNALPRADQLNFIDFVEGRVHGPMRDPQLQAMANTMRAAFDQRMSKLQSLPSTAQAQFITDYFPHFWKDPGAASTAGQNFSGGASRQGSGASLRKRSVPTYADGLAMGLEPVTTNPIEATLRYIRSMDHFIASTEVLDIAKAQGTVRYIKPQTVGASGHPSSFKIPPGWKPIQGRGATRPDGSVAHAPEDWALVYNNFIDRGIHGKSEAWGKIYDAAQSTSNAITALELGLSGFHAFTMGNEAFVSGIAKGVGEVAGGRPIKGVGSIVTAPIKGAPAWMHIPGSYGHTGKKMEKVYLGQNPGSPNMSRIVDLLEKAGGRAVGKAHSPDYRFSPMGSYWTAFKRGALKQEIAESKANIAARPVVGSAKEAARFIGRTMETVAQPLFEKYIPRIKNGAFYDTMHSWLEAHPTASMQEQVAEARRVWDSIDNRFGEMVQDNIFWNKSMKQGAQLGMRSYSWNMGTIREIGGGVKDIVDTAAGRKEWSTRASYVVALPIAVGTLNAAYQYLMTGKHPESVDDLLAGRTGGTSAGFGGRGEVEERVSLPGYQKDVLGWYENWRQEAFNKVATGPRAGVIDPIRDADYKGDPVFHAGHAALEDYFAHVIGSMGPISVKTMVQGPKTGSNIGRMQQLMGLRPAGPALQDPEGYKRGMGSIQQRREQREIRHEKQQQRLYE